MRAMNSAGVFASRSFTLESPRPALMMWTCASLNPGTSICPCASMTFVPLPASFRISALEPTAAIRSPRTAIASAHGRFGFPVQMRAFTTASVTGALCATDGAARVNAVIMAAMKAKKVRAEVGSEPRSTRRTRGTFRAFVI